MLRFPALCLALSTALAGLSGFPATALQAAVVRGTYVNPLPATSSRGAVENCPDPSILRGRGAQAGRWYMYCTSGPLSDRDTSGSGAPISHRLPMLRSADLVHWSYLGSALSVRPSWAGARAKLWAPDAVYSSRFDRYYLTFAVTDTIDAVSGEPACTTDPAIGVAVSTTPAGPWRVAGKPLVPPQRLGPGCSFASTIDPDVLFGSVTDKSVLYYGGFRGGIQAQPVSLSATGMRTAGSATPVTAARRYEAANVVHHGDWYYLVASSGQCCNGPLSGYGSFAGRSHSPYGPFLDREGIPLLASRTGGTPVLLANGNHWVGPGHTSIFADRGGQWWAAYHAVDRSDPFFATEPGFTRRPPLLDPIDWVGGWPVARTGRGPSASRVPAPAAQAGQRSAYRPSPAPLDLPGAQLLEQSDDFEGEALSERWSWVRQPDESDYRVSDGSLRIATQAGQLVGDQNTAPVLTQALPAGDYVVDTEVRLDVPATGDGYGAVQAGLVIYGDDDSYVKLAHTVAGETRQTALAIEVPAGLPGYPRYGSTAGGPPGETTWLRLVKRTSGASTVYRGYTSLDGAHWTRASSWRDDALGGSSRIGLIAMGGAGYLAEFSYLHVSSLQ